MAIQGIEWIAVIVVLVILFLWGPEKLPKFARAIGQARREFEKASKGIEEELVKSVNVSPTVSSSPASDDKLIEVAKALGIQTEGKTRDELAKEIIARTQKQS